MRVCPSCGEENADKAKFCSECATPLGVRGDRSERKIVTALFCDLVGSTALGETYDPEVLKPVLRAYFDEARAAVERHGGRVEKFIGDAVAAVFGMPTTHEDDALRAVRAGAEIQERVRRLNEEGAIPVSCRIGVNTGEVLASGDDTPLVGDAMNTAARLQSAAEPGGVLLGEPTFRLVGDAVEVEPAEPIAAKGKAEPVSAWRLLRVIPGAEGHLRRMDSVMVGRDGELALLRQAFERSVRDRACMLFTILGAAGVGKSRLAEEFLAGLDATVLRGRCLHYGDGITYWPVVEILTSAAGITEDDTPEAVRAKLETALAGADDATIVVERLANLLGVGGEAVPDETHWAIRKLLEHLAAERPLVVVFDDIHWGEPTFLDLIEHIADWSRDAPILLLCMARPELLDECPTWGGGKLNATTVLLEPLPHDACETLLTNLLGDGDGGLDPPATERILAAAGGNPLFVEEMLRMLADRGLLVHGDTGWKTTADLTTVEVPPTIQALLTARLDRLQRPERSALERGAVEGNVFHRGAVAALLEPEPAADVGKRLMDLTRKELIRPDRAEFAGEDAFRFHHLLIRDAAYRAMPKEVRGDLHERFADWLLAAAGERAAEFDEIVGYHLEQAHFYRAELGASDEAQIALGVRAARHLAAGARRAEGRGDLTATGRLAGRAALLMPPDDRERPAILTLLGSARFESADFQAAVEAFEEAEVRGTAAGDERSVWRARIERATIRMLLAPGEVSSAQVAETALAAIEVFERLHDEEGLAVAWNGIAEDLTSYRPRPGGEGMAARERAFAHALRSGSSGLIARIAGTLAQSTAIERPLEEARTRVLAILDQLRTTPSVAAYAYLNLVYIEAMLGRFDDARSALAESERLARELGSAFVLEAKPAYRAELDRALGDLDAAVASWREIASRLERSGERAIRSTMLGEMARVQILRGDEDDALRCASECRELAGPDDLISQMLWRQAEGRVLVHRGSTDEGLSMIGEAVALGERTDWSIFRSDAYLDLARALVDAGRPEEAVEPARTALALLQQKGAVALIPPVEALLAELEHR